MSADDVGDTQPVEHQPDERELLREEIERVREDLGETVEALAGKADLKGQVHDKVQDTKAQVHDKVDEVKAHVGMGAGAGAGAGTDPAKSDLRKTLAGPAVPAALAAVCALLLLRSLRRRR